MPFQRYQICEKKTLRARKTYIRSEDCEKVDLFHTFMDDHLRFMKKLLIYIFFLLQNSF